MIEEKTGIPSGAFGICCEGKYLRDKKIIRECNIAKDSTIHLIGRLRGGGISLLQRAVIRVVSLAYMQNADKIKRYIITPEEKKHVDWRTEGVVTSVKHQLNCGEYKIFLSITLYCFFFKEAIRFYVFLIFYFVALQIVAGRLQQLRQWNVFMQLKKGIDRLIGATDFRLHRY